MCWLTVTNAKIILKNVLHYKSTNYLSTPLYASFTFTPRYNDSRLASRSAATDSIISLLLRACVCVSERSRSEMWGIMYVDMMKNDRHLSSPHLWVGGEWKTTLIYQSFSGTQQSDGFGQSAAIKALQFHTKFSQSLQHPVKRAGKR